MIMFLKKTSEEQTILYRSTLWLLTLVMVDIVSMVGWHWPMVASILTVILVIAWLALAVKNLPLAVILLLVELIVGSFGRQVSLSWGTFEIPLRLGLFLAALAVMLYRLASNRHHVIFRHPWRWWFMGAVGVILWGAGRGYYLWNQPENLFLDLNGYLYLLLLPLFVEVYIQAGRDRLIYYSRILLLPSVIWLTVRTLILLYLFTHLEPEHLLWLYKWYRDTGLGEITAATNGFWRIFSQSQIYSALATALGLAWLWRYSEQTFKINWRQPIVIFTFIAMTGLVASLSRSLWLGVSVVWLLIPILSRANYKFKVFARYLVWSVILVVTASVSVLAVSRLSWPLPPLALPSGSALADRFGIEAAGQARINLWLPLWRAIQSSPYWGSGFGATVQYFSTDPRIVASTAGGSGFTTTYAFEWGWLDLWYKLGLVGLILWTMWLLVPWRYGWRAWLAGDWWGAGIFALLTLYIVHFTTPYLNHPLGLGAVLALGACLIPPRTV